MKLKEKVDIFYQFRYIPCRYVHDVRHYLPGLRPMDLKDPDATIFSYKSYIPTISYTENVT